MVVQIETVTRTIRKNQFELDEIEALDKVFDLADTIATTMEMREIEALESTSTGEVITTSDLYRLKGIIGGLLGTYSWEEIPKG